MEIEIEKIIHIYNSGYHAGHHDTVEGQYTDILSCDMDTYHEDVVRGLIEELGIGQGASKETHNRTTWGAQHGAFVCNRW